MAKTARQISNLRLALELWAKVPPEHVLPRLAWWRGEPSTHEEDGYEEITDIRKRTAAGLGCGTLACFGGHLAQWPEFQALGVQTDYWYGAPTTAAGDSAPSVALALFGDEKLFNKRAGHPADFSDTLARESIVTDHQLVANRLLWAKEH